MSVLFEGLERPSTSVWTVMCVFVDGYSLTSSKKVSEKERVVRCEMRSERLCNRQKKLNERHATSAYLKTPAAHTTSMLLQPIHAASVQRAVFKRLMKAPSFSFFFSLKCRKEEERTLLHSLVDPSCESGGGQ